jgi:hypothetical protein
MPFVTTPPEMPVFAIADLQSVGSAVVAGLRFNTFAVCRADKES